MDPEIYISNQRIVKNLKFTRILAILGIVFSGIFIFESIASLVAAILFPPVVGLIPGIVLEAVAFMLCLISWAFMVAAFIIMIYLSKKVKPMEDSPEMLEAIRILKFLQIFIFVILCVNLLVSILMGLVNIVTIILFVI